MEQILNTDNKVFIYRFYIGSNNKTKKREIQKAINLLNLNDIKGYTLLKSYGFWENIKENSFIFEIIANKENPFNDNKAFFIRRLLEKELKQYLVIVTKQELQLI